MPETMDPFEKMGPEREKDEYCDENFESNRRWLGSCLRHADR